MKKVFVLLISMALLFSLNLTVFAESRTNNSADFWEIYQASADTEPEINAKSAVLIERETGAVLYAKNENEALAPASVTKTMTLLIVAEFIESGKISKDDEVLVSAYAASMGGSQVFLKEGELMSAEELIKCTVIASANDAAVSLAEHCAGSESAFVSLMNERARALGLTSTTFENVTGLDDDVTNHTMSAGDIAKISRELLRHDIIRKYSSVWQDSIRNGEFTLTNTNRLVRYYSGCTGLKTGSTDKAGFCVSASAKRGDCELIAVIMGAETSSERNEAARTLLDFGFSTYALYKSDARSVGDIPVKCASTEKIPLKADGFCSIVNKADLKRVSVTYELPSSVSAPIKKGSVIGKAVYKIDEKILGTVNIYADADIERIGFLNLFGLIFKASFIK